MDSADGELESAAVELTFPDSSDLSYPDSTNVGIEGEEASTGDLRDQLVTPEPNLDDKHGLSGISNHNVPDTSSDLPNPPDAPSLSSYIGDVETNARGVSITPTTFKPFSIDLSTNLVGHISTDDSGFCLSMKDNGDNEVDDSSADEQNPEMESSSYVNGALSTPDETQGVAVDAQFSNVNASGESSDMAIKAHSVTIDPPSPNTNVADPSPDVAADPSSDMAADASSDMAADASSDVAADPSSDMVIEAHGVTIDAPSSNMNVAEESCEMAAEAFDSPANPITSKDIESPVPATVYPPTSTIAGSSSAMEISPETETNDNQADDYMDSDVINDIDDSVADAEVQKARREELPAVDPNDWRKFPLVFFDEEDEKKLRAFNEDPDDGASRSRHTSSARSTPDIPEDGETRPSTPNWSTDGSNVLETFDDLINLLPCDLRGWAIQKSDCGNRLALIHSVVDFKTLDLKTDVMVVFEREKQKLKKSSYNLPKDPPLDRSTRHLLDDARGSRGRSAPRNDETYPDSKSAESPRWNYLIKYMPSGLTNKLSGPRSLTPACLCSILRFALRPPAGLKRKYSEADVDEIIEEDVKRPRRTPSSTAANSTMGSSMLECYKCKNLVSMEMWSQHPCFKQAVYQPNVGSKRGGSAGSGNKNDLFCKYCKLRFKDKFALKGHEIKFPGGSCNMVINCSICKKKFTSRGSYAIHLQGADGKKCKKGMFRCQVCKSFWVDDLELIDHFRKSHPCTKCGRFQPNTFQDYDAHSRSCFRSNVSYPTNQFAAPSASNAPGSQSCRHCLLIFGSPAELAVHLRTSRSCGDAVKMPSTPAMPRIIIQCQQCRKTFNTNQDLVDHMKRWHKQQTYLHRCPFCPKNFATAEMLKAHCSKVHGNASNSQATTYDCKVCSLKFISFSGLSRHLKMKHGIRGGNQNDNAQGGSGGGGGGVVGNGGADRNFQSRAPAASVGVNVSSVSTPVTLDFKNYSDSAVSSTASPLPAENKTLSESDFLFVPFGEDDGGGDGGGGNDSFKCGNCFLFFDDPSDFKEHCASCK